MSKNRLDAVIFDFDGVLVDSVDVKTRAFAELYKDYGEQIQKQVVAYHLENKGVSRFHKFRYFQSELLGKPAGEQTIIELARRFADLVKHKVISAAMIPGANQALKHLHNRNIPLYVATGTPEEEILEIIEKREMEFYFAGVYGSPRTKSEILEMIIDTNSYHSECCVMAGDAIEDYRAARHNGCRFIGVAYQAASGFSTDIQPLPDLTRFIDTIRETFRFDI